MGRAAGSAVAAMTCGVTGLNHAAAVATVAVSGTAIVGAAGAIIATVAVVPSMISGAVAAVVGSATVIATAITITVAITAAGRGFRLAIR